jgi:hypothetical protein
MATYNINTSRLEEAGLSQALAQANAQRAAQVPPLPALTAAQYLAQLVSQALRGWVDQYSSTLAQQVAANYATATLANRQLVWSTFGVADRTALPMSDQQSDLQALWPLLFPPLSNANKLTVLQALGF